MHLEELRRLKSEFENLSVGANATLTRNRNELLNVVSLAIPDKATRERYLNDVKRVWFSPQRLIVRDVYDGSGGPNPGELSSAWEDGRREMIAVIDSIAHQVRLASASPHFESKIVPYDQYRQAVLEVIYDLQHSGELPMWSSQIAARLTSASQFTAITFTEVDQALDYLAGKYMVETRPLPGARNIKPRHYVLSITAGGMDYIERASKITQPTTSSRHVQNFFYGNVGAVQSGDRPVANVTQNIGTEAAALAEALIELCNATRGMPETQALGALASDAASEAKQRGALTDKLRILLTSIALIVPTIGESIPAYHAVQLAAAALGHPLPPMPP